MCNFVAELGDQMTNKEIYEQLCRQRFTPLFSRSYWLEAVSRGKEWEVLMVWKDEEQPHSLENLAAALPVHVSRKWGICRLLMPQQTPMLHPYLAEDQDETTIFQKLAKELDRFCLENRVAYAYLQGDLPSAFRTALQREAFEVGERQTYRVKPMADRDEIARSFHENKRRQLRKADNLHLVTMTPDAFYAYHADCLKRQGKVISYSIDFATELLWTLEEKGNVRLLGVAREDGTILAAVGLVEDEHTMYYLLPTYRPDCSKSGAMAWLTCEAIHLAGEQGKVFDFEGSMVPSIARSYREFGGNPETYYSVEKYYSRLYEFVWKTCLRK